MAGDDDVDQIHALGIALGVEGEGVVAFGDVTQVAIGDEAAVNVVDAELGIAGGGSIEFEVSFGADGVRIEVYLVGADGVDSGDVNNGGVVLGVDNLVGEVGDILDIHEDTAAVGAEVEGTGPFGFGESELVLGDAGVGDVVADGQVAGLLAHGGHRDILEVGVGLPSGAAFLGEDALVGADEDGSGGVFNEGAIGGDSGVRKGKEFEIGGGAGGIDDGDIGEVGRVFVEGEDKTVDTVAMVNNDVADGTGEPNVIVIADGVRRGDSETPTMVRSEISLSVRAVEKSMSSRWEMRTSMDWCVAVS